MSYNVDQLFKSNVCGRVSLTKALALSVLSLALLPTSGLAQAGYSSGGDQRPLTEPVNYTNAMRITSNDGRERRLDALAACAGRSDSRSIAETGLDDWRRVMTVNLDAAFLSVNYGAMAMRESRSGSIVSASSERTHGEPDDRHRRHFGQL